MTQADPPSVFISHASEDKDRFVTQFAKKLRDQGIDAWLDDWEMMPGDSLVDKIFNHGIKKSSMFIVVLSRASVQKPWVNEEINRAFLSRIESSNYRIIPIIIDDCDVPECLKSTLWVSIRDITDYDSDLNRIVSSIYGMTDKPPLGPPPEYLNLPRTLVLPQLAAIDCLILEAACRESIRIVDKQINDLRFLDTIADSGVSNQEIRDSITVLNEMGYLDTGSGCEPTYRGLGLLSITIRIHAFDLFIKHEYPEYSTWLDAVISGIVNQDWRNNTDVVFDGLPHRISEHFVDLLDNRGLIKVEWHFGGFMIVRVSPQLSRMLESRQ